MADPSSPQPPRETTPSLISSIPQKRALPDDTHSPAVPSPLNPDGKSQKVQIQPPAEEGTTMGREKRTKKESLKKRESKGATGGDSSRASPAPKPKEQPGEMAPLRYKLAPPKITDFDLPRGPVFTSHHEVQDSEGRSIEFYETSDHVYNKKNFHYTHCIADPTFPSMFYYRNTEPEPYGAHLNFEDAASHMYFDQQGTHVTSDKGFRMARANVAVREGRWYWECKVTRGILKKKNEGDPESHGHIRLGFARREASLDAPVGFDAYSYGIRDKSGQKIHMSRPKDFFPEGEDIKEGDVIGLEIQLPSERLHRKVVQGHYNPAVDLIAEDEGHPDGISEYPNIIRDRIPIRFKAHIYFEKIDYHTTKELEELMNPSSGPNNSSEPPNPNHTSPALRTLPNSYIKVYKNGKFMGTPFTDLLAFLPPASRMVNNQQAGGSGGSGVLGGRDVLDDGSVGYYPAVSVFRGGAVECNFGPNFWYPPPEFSQQQPQGEDVIVAEGDASQKPEAGENQPRALADRYDEQIVEDILYDIVDEVGFWSLGLGRGGSKDEKLAEGGTGLAMPPGGGREEIKELVQDD
ncbi:transcription factor, contains a PHD finger motif [Podospora pseudoanserina]|uniref:Transcription factor, contains a PHD finger motif n=1 Tax=Podospora pseudoanserina TaxID=2609844 RepID=A0ABR0ISA8_9PEZI|nr:transcription factor, contains a PHD finger motif [Podospora pseudoanserina]